MSKTTQTIVAIIVIAALAVGGYFVFRKSNSNSPAYSSNTTPQTSSQTPASQPSSAAGPIIQTKSASNVGQYLADANGSALYTYGGDTQGVSNCTGSCLYSWPVYQATSSTNLPANVTVIKRSDGTKQYAYKGMPLYTFTGDSSGQVTGDGVSNFHIAKP